MNNELHFFPSSWSWTMWLWIESFFFLLLFFFFVCWKMIAKQIAVLGYLWYKTHTHTQRHEYCRHGVNDYEEHPPPPSSSLPLPTCFLFLSPLDFFHLYLLPRLPSYCYWWSLRWMQQFKPDFVFRFRIHSFWWAYNWVFKDEFDSLF